MTPCSMAFSLSILRWVSSAWLLVGVSVEVAFAAAEAEPAAPTVPAVAVRLPAGSSAACPVAVAGPVAPLPIDGISKTIAAR
jgi:hypothetical protein